MGIVIARVERTAFFASSSASGSTLSSLQPCFQCRTIDKRASHAAGRTAGRARWRARTTAGRFPAWSSVSEEDQKQVGVVHALEERFIGADIIGFLAAGAGQFGM